ncbi:hypothetical protein A5699_07095 [Mycobacterium sp. E802]|uniref:hypothetical protein n=1 Tax=Mycobacterium sp. E802 TaxID=1834152 RepID=UPI000800E796|nr:hypothetical protein [Mycobacterium sp. E802]OBG82142.1 hypothetical protein A5699_07095 [Mycobacterium sp. E802]
MTTSLEQQAEDFANELTLTTRAVVGEDTPAFFAVALQEADAFRVRHEPASGVILCDREAPILRLAVDYICIYDGHNQFMAIEKSKIHVFVEPNGKEPLFRYEFSRNVIGGIPGAHIQFHGTHAECSRR